MNLPKQQKKSTTLSNSKRKRNQQSGLVVENINLPVRILDCKEGEQTQYGTNTLRFNFQHLVSKEEFPSTVFEQSAPAYIDDQIVNAVLPPDVEDYLLEDLVNRGLFVQLKFRTRGDNTYINVVKAQALDDKHQQMLEELLKEENRESLELSGGIDDDEEIELGLEEDEEYDEDDSDLVDEDDME
ncbi:hypothetical protein MKZ20_03850 [Psychrobacillus sp. FSL K6-2684]|uniref:hypothetical protein n=1 Tax=Psychrobacillus sp. FSL K6-2684 TaxID=2921547 RepID=UPI0030F5E5F5